MFKRTQKRVWLQVQWVIFACEIKFFLAASWFLVCAGTGNRYDFRNRYPVPIFLTRDFNATFTVGSTAVLNCSVANLGTRTVVWQKVPSEAAFPSKITLTIGQYPFVSDPSISILHDPNKYNWDLRFDQIQFEDAGKYECQVSSSDKTLRQTVYVTVKDRERIPVKPSIQIYAPETVEKDEKLEIYCNATGTNMNQLDELDWFRNGYKVDTEFDKGVLIEKKISLSKNKISSTLHIARAQMSDGGTYTCRTSAEQVKTVNVQVLTTGDVNRPPRDKDQETEAPAMLPGISNNSHKHAAKLQSKLVFLLVINLWFWT